MASSRRNNIVDIALGHLESKTARKSLGAKKYRKEPAILKVILHVDVDRELFAKLR